MDSLKLEDRLIIVNILNVIKYLVITSGDDPIILKNAAKAALTAFKRTFTNDDIYFIALNELEKMYSKCGNLLVVVHIDK